MAKNWKADAARPQKHSLTLQGHRTSVTLEPAFWRAFVEVAAKREISVNALASELDRDRGSTLGLASAIRLFVLSERPEPPLWHPTPEVSAVTAPKDRQRLVSDILKTLPDWFGQPEANATYARQAASQNLWAMSQAGEAVGVIALEKSTAESWEITLLAVAPIHHRKGIGRKLVAAAARHATKAGGTFLIAKTLSAQSPDPFYAKTRAFYRAMGFSDMLELPNHWAEHTPCLVLARTL